MPVNTAAMVARQRFGEALKQARLAATTPEGQPIKQTDAARAIRRRTIDRVSRLERGESWPEPKELEALLKLYRADLTTRVTLETMVREGQSIASAWWTEYEEDFPRSLIEFIAYEDSAQRITTCAGGVIPGLLQTEGYARALTSHLAKSTLTTHLVERSVELRTKRRGIFDKPAPPGVEAVIGEAALRQKIGGTAAMLAQLDGLLEDAAERGVVVRVIPFDAKATLTYMFHLVEFGEEDKPIAAFDAMMGMAFRESSRELQGLRVFLDDLRELALSPEDSLETIRTIAKDMSHD